MENQSLPTEIHCYDMSDTNDVNPRFKVPVLRANQKLLNNPSRILRVSKSKKEIPIKKPIAGYICEIKTLKMTYKVKVGGIIKYAPLLLFGTRSYSIKLEHI